MYEHTITCNSLSKTYSITGWRLEYLIGPEEVIECSKKVHDFLSVGTLSIYEKVFEKLMKSLMKNFLKSFYEKQKSA